MNIFLKILLLLSMSWLGEIRASSTDNTNGTSCNVSSELDLTSHQIILGGFVNSFVRASNMSPSSILELKNDFNLLYSACLSPFTTLINFEDIYEKISSDLNRYLHVSYSIEAKNIHSILLNKTKNFVHNIVDTKFNTRTYCSSRTPDFMFCRRDFSEVSQRINDFISGEKLVFKVLKSNEVKVFAAEPFDLEAKIKIWVNNENQVGIKIEKLSGHEEEFIEWKDQILKIFQIWDLEIKDHNDVLNYIAVEHDYQTKLIDSFREKYPALLVIEQNSTSVVFDINYVAFRVRFCQMIESQQKLGMIVELIRGSETNYHDILESLFFDPF